MQRTNHQKIRQQNNKARKQQANERRMMREYETAIAKLYELAFAYGEGRPITAVEKSVLYSENLTLFTAAEAKREGQKSVFVELLRINDDVYSVWGENAFRLNAATKGRELATAVADSVGEIVNGVGWGSWPAARPEDITGYRYGLKHGQAGAVKGALTPTAPLHRKVKNLCNQILSEATAGQSLLLLKIEGDEWSKVKERWKKRDGARYCAIPQGQNTFAVIHNQTKEGGEALAEKTFGYSKSELYGLIRPLVENQQNIITFRDNQVVKLEIVRDERGQIVNDADGKPQKNKVIGTRKESKRYQATEGWGNEYRGSRDRRPKEEREKDSFSVTGYGDIKRAARLLGVPLTTRGYGSDMLKDASDARNKIQLLIDNNLLDGLNEEKLASLNAFLAEAERRKAEAEAEFPTYAQVLSDLHLGVSRENEAVTTAVGERVELVPGAKWLKRRVRVGAK